MSNGGIVGTGLGSGTPQNIPLNHSDFIFASIVSEWGYIGGGAIIILIFTLIYRIFRSTYLLPRHSFSSLLITGIGSLFLIQTTINIGGVFEGTPADKINTVPSLAKFSIDRRVTPSELIENIEPELSLI